MGACLRLVKPNEPVPKRRLGQHFLRDTEVLDRIVRWIGPRPDDVFIDIGAGDGALSARLAAVAHLIAIEVDSDCIPRLKAALTPFSSATVVAGDVLHMNMSDVVSPYIAPGRKLRIAGNLPYNVATAIVQRLLHSGLPVEDMSFMVQYEVAQRIAARPGSRKYGYISVYCQHHAEVRMGFKVSPAGFIPRPRVVSAMISLRPKASSFFDPAVESDFESLVKAAFGHRRKKLENSLTRHPLFGPLARELIRRSNIDGSRRAEELSVSEYEQLARICHELKNDKSRMTNDEC